MAPRIPIPEDKDLPEDILGYITKARESGVAVNLSNMLLNAPASLKEFNAMGGSILFKSEFPPRSREIAETHS